MKDITSLEKKLSGLEEQLKKYREVLLANLVMIGEIPAPTSDENRRVKFILNRFDEAGLTDSSIDGSGNGIGVLSGKDNSEAILINAHADTIFSAKIDHTMQVSSNSITGPGVADNSLGLAALVTLPYILEDMEVELNRDLVLLAGVKSLGRGNLEGIHFFLDNNPFLFRQQSVHNQRSHLH